MTVASTNLLDTQPTDGVSLFNKENKKVWEISLKRRKNFLEQYSEFILPEYIEGFYSLNFDVAKIPTLEQLNKSLKPTGWQVVHVDGYMHQNDYTKLLSQKISPVSRYMRSLAHLHYAPGPDMLHDIFGHLPMLFSPSYSDYISSLGKVMEGVEANADENELYQLHLKLAKSHEFLGASHPQTIYIEDKIKAVEHNIEISPNKYTILGRFFMWTIEFGILKNGNKFQMFGAGLLSSENESEDFCKGKATVIPFTHAATKMGYNFSDFQKQYYFSNSFNELKAELKNLEQSFYKLSCSS